MKNSKLDKNVKKIVHIDNLSPEYLYYPINEANTKFYIDSKTPIFKETLLYECSNRKYYSNVSGKAVGTKNFGDKDYLVIKNDFKEKYEKPISLRKKINKLSKKEILDILINTDGSNCSQNIKYFMNNFDSIDSLVLSLLVCEDSERIFTEVFNDCNSDILELFDALSQIFEIKNPIIILSDTDDKNIEFVTNLSGMYPDIRITLSHDKYPASHPLLITRKLNLSNALVLTPMDLYYLYSLIKRNKKVFEKEILITGSGYKDDYIVNTKTYVLISDLLKSCNISVSDNDVICKNSAIKADIITLNDVVDLSVDSIIIEKKILDSPKECLNCGLCNKNCPQKINPQIYKINKLPFPGKCINCNMCSYICPNKIRKDV